jgi:hypothetical protein
MRAIRNKRNKAQLMIDKVTRWGALQIPDPETGVFMLAVRNRNASVFELA